MSIKRLWLFVAVLLVLDVLLMAALSRSKSDSPDATPGHASVATPPTANGSPTAGGWIALSPASGPPGTVVTVTGYLPSLSSATPAPDQSKPSTAVICWDGCAGGLRDQSIPIELIDGQPGLFSLRFAVPAIPWLGRDGIHSPVGGDYAVELGCLTPAPGQGTAEGCAGGSSLASTVFHLSGEPARTCDDNDCVQLSLTPAEASPGATIQLSGWAPVAMLANGHAAGYGLALLRADGLPGNAPLADVKLQQADDGSLSGSFKLPENLAMNAGASGRFTVVLQVVRDQVAGPLPKPAGIGVAPYGASGSALYTLPGAPLTVAPPPRWAGEGSSTPLWSASSLGLASAAPTFDPTNPQRIAYCDGAGIRVSVDGGASWSSVPTSGAVDVAAGSDFPLTSPTGAGQPGCLDVMLEPAHPDSYFASFPAVQKNVAAAPVVYLGFVTTDAGRTWHPLPVPEGRAATDFAGFERSGSQIQALFFTAQPNVDPKAPPAFVIEGSTDGGQNWMPSQLTCPDSGPCVRWGPALLHASGMGVAAPRYVVYSPDGGQTWQSPDPPLSVNLRSPYPSQLVATSASGVAVLSGSDPTPVRVSTDGGKTWAASSLPPLPESAANVAGYPGLTALPSGALLARGGIAGPWYLLAPGSQEWCGTAGTDLPAAPSALQPINDRLWWLERSADPNAPIAAKSVPLDSIRCGG